MKSLLISLSLFGVVFICSTTSVSAQLEGITPTPEIINPQGSRFCTEFDMAHQETNVNDSYFPTPIPSSGAVQGTSDEEVAGELKMTKEGLPDFSLMEEDLTSTLNKLLPQDLKDMFSVQGNSLTGKAKHFVLGKRDDGTFKLPDSKVVPETDTAYPSWLTQLIGKSKVMCGMFGTCTAAKSLDIRIQPFIAKVSNSSYKSRCDLDSTEVVEKNPEVNPVQPIFKTKSISSISEVITDIIDEIKKIVIGRRTATTKVTELKDITSGVWPASNFRQYSSFQNASIPADFLDENGPLKGSADFYVTNAVITPGGNDRVNFQNFGLTRLQRCLQLCSLYPSEVDIKSIDPLCPSCDKTDFGLKKTSGLDDPVLDTSLCRKNPDGSCNYCSPIGGEPYVQSCEGDPACESGLCCPLQYRQAIDYTSHGCPVPYNATDCFDTSICQRMHFEQNSGGGFGNCQYTSSDPCVRTDREDTESCAALCTDVCCSN